MKYLYLIIRHLFPKSRWKIIKETQVFDRYAIGKIPYKIILTLQDQFGNIKTKEIK